MLNAPQKSVLQEKIDKKRKQDDFSYFDSCFQLIPYCDSSAVWNVYYLLFFVVNICKKKTTNKLCE